jgi:DNA-binding CsgD family transcriptional regulator
VPQLLQQLYGLKASEARLAAALLDGQTLESYAARAGLSVQTARSYLKGVFEATGTHRQSELVLLLAQGPLELLG